MLITAVAHTLTTHTHTHAYMDKHRHTLVFASAEYRNRFWWNTLQHTQLPAHTHTLTYVMTHSTYTYLNNMCTHTHTRTNTKLKTHARNIAFCSFSVFAHKTCTLPPGGVREACVIYCISYRIAVCTYVCLYLSNWFNSILCLCTYKFLVLLFNRYLRRHFTNVKQCRWFVFTTLNSCFAR